ncbi:hypothetical protein T12_13959 [Trichinella patagoniensis]|uniref:Uncharacterized protein n=1 Tax=Trichinella patagoniensis TaxID=990121 RepID=A0A0V1A7N8_9BILA|nr:hypothetical protein T12_13959 [Trichinella patagoniensis]
MAYHCTFDSVPKPSFSVTNRSLEQARSLTPPYYWRGRRYSATGRYCRSVENESFANEEKGRNPPFDFEKALTLYGQLDSLQLEFEEELEAEDSEIERQIWTGLRNRFLSLRAPWPSRNRWIRLVVKTERFACHVSNFRSDVTFCDQFEVSVHQQVDLSNATKLAYLRGCLTGAALDALREGVLPDDSVNGGLSVAEVMITTARERLPNLVRIQWDKLTMEDGSLVADLTVFLRFLQEQIELSNTNERSEIGREAVDRCIAEAEKFCRLQFLSEAAHACGVREIETGESPEAAGDSNPLLALLFLLQTRALILDLQE